MYAVIETGGKQYRVEVGTELAVELLDAEPGSQITLDRVLLVADGEQASIGRPVVPGAAVSATVLRRDRGDKVISFKYKPKARSRVKKGHRQEQTVLRIADIQLNGRSAADDVAKAQATQATEHELQVAAAEEKAAADAALAAKLAERLAVPDAETETAPSKPARARAAKAAPAAKGSAPAEAADTSAPAKAADAAAPAKAADTSAPEPAEAGDAPAAAAPAKPRRARAPKKED